MGFVRKAISVIAGGGAKPLAQAAAASPLVAGTAPNAALAPSAAASPAATAAAASTPAAAAQTPAQAAEEERKRKLLQVNAGATQGNITGSNGVIGNADTTRKTLLGL